MIVRNLEHIRVLTVEPGGKHAELGLGVVGTPGARVRADATAINNMALSLLAAGHELHRAGAPAPDGEGQRFTSEAVFCSRIGVGTGDNGELMLMLDFGANRLIALVDKRDVKRALELLRTASEGGLMSPPAATQ